MYVVVTRIGLMMSVPNETIIATYFERLPQVCRVFRLYYDRVEIAARWTIGKKYKVTISLDCLSDKVTFSVVKNRWFSKAIMIGSLFVCSALVFSRGEYPYLVRRMATACWSIAGISLVVAIFSFPKKQFVHFQQRNGKPGLDICKTGSQNRFDSFVNELRKRIVQAKKR